MEHVFYKDNYVHYNNLFYESFASWSVGQATIDRHIIYNVGKGFVFFLFYFIF